MTEPYAWLVAIAAALVAMIGIAKLTSPMRRGFMRSWLRGLAALVMLLPAPVPGFEPNFAPASLVVFFEALLQRAGKPALATGLLLTGIVVYTLLVWGYHYWHRRRYRNPYRDRL